MLAPPAVLTPDSRLLIDRIVDRNARLIVRLTKVQSQLHHATHGLSVRWARCPEESCRLTRIVIERNSLEDGI